MFLKRQYYRWMEFFLIGVMAAVIIPGLMREPSRIDEAGLPLNLRSAAAGMSRLFKSSSYRAIKSTRSLYAFYLMPGNVAPAARPAAPAELRPGAPAVNIAVSGPFSVVGGSGKQAAAFNVGRRVRLSYQDGRYYLDAGGLQIVAAGYLRVVPRSDAIITLPDYTDWNWNRTLNLNQFRGSVEIRYSPLSRRLWVINVLPLEDYLKGVSEAGADAPTEHLRVMSIIERSYAWYHLHSDSRHRGEPFDLKNSRNGNGDDQIYQGYLAEKRLPMIAAAAAATSGLVVTYKGKPVITPYSSNPGGRTRTPKEVGWNYNWPWVKSVPDPDTAGMKRQGHGVGLSGYGSRQRAKRGETAAQIISYYFPGTKIGRVATADVKIRIAVYSLPANNL